jgi:glycosyltransferase involved in cell wall biosynthesis
MNIAEEAGSRLPIRQEGSLELSIVMPCLNEAETLERCIRSAQSFLAKHAVNGEVVVGDNGSTDGSQEIARKCGARVVAVPVKGYGAALSHAIRCSSGKYVIMGDSDDSYDFSALMPFIEKLRRGDDLVMGNRFLGGISPGAMPWKNRWLGNPVLTAIGRRLFHAPVGDFHCGIRGFARSSFDKMDLRTLGMEFASEMVIKASLLGMRVSEVPTTLKKDGRSRPPHLRPWRDGWRHLRMMLLFSPRWLFLIPGLALFSAGLLLGARIWWGPLQIGEMRFEVSSLAFATAGVLIGFQSISFAVLSKVFAIHEGLLPPDPRLSRLLRYVTFETGLVVGGLLFLAGFCGGVRGVLSWRDTGFGQLNPYLSLRIALPSSMALTLGFQVMMNSFFLSVLGMRLQNARSADANPD